MSAAAGSRRGRGLLLAAVTCVALAAVALWWVQTFERKEVEVPLAPRGEAAYNPLYALKLALQADGVTVHSRRRLALPQARPGPADTMVLLGDLRALPQRDADRLLDWVAQGGHLVAELPPPPGSFRPQAGGPVLDALGVTSQAVSWGCERLAPRTVNGRAGDDAVSVCGRARIGLAEDVEPQLYWLDANSRDLYARIAHGKGSVDLLVSLDLLRNPGLEHPTAAAVARQLLAPHYGRGAVHLVYAAEMPPLWRLVLERGWMAWLPLLLALAGWLWWRTQRRGPLLPSPPPVRRALIEHVQASGEHIHRYGRGHLLHASLRTLFETRLQRRDPYAASLEGDARRAAIAKRTGLPESEIDAALRAPVPFVAADLRLRIAKLNRLRHRL